MRINTLKVKILFSKFHKFENNPQCFPKKSNMKMDLKSDSFLFKVRGNKNQVSIKTNLNLQILLIITINKIKYSKVNLNNNLYPINRMNLLRVISMKAISLIPVRSNQKATSR
jgi:hypothetical protein